VGVCVHAYDLLKNNNNNNHLTAPVETSTWQERPGSYPTDCRRVPWKTHTRFNTRYTHRILCYYIILYIIQTRKNKQNGGNNV